MSLIEVKDVTKIYQDGAVFTPALSGVSLSINEGEFVAVMGPSGSGKSTLLHILGFLDRHTDGEYLLDGKAMDDYTEDEIAIIRNTKIGFIFQSFNLMPKTSVLENVKLPLLYSNKPEFEWNALAEAAIKSVGLEHRIHHESGELSGGEKQRVAIARALVNKPKVIFADEPTGNLDSKSGGVIMQTIKELSDLGHTIVLITHETYAAEYAQRIIKLKDGKIESDQKVNHRRTSSDQFMK